MLNIWVGNLGKYNEGELVGGWLELPKEQKEIDEFLKNVVGLNEEYEEYMINDFETDLPYEVSEYESISNLNLLATLSENIEEMDSINAYVDSQGEMTLEELANLLAQAEDIAYYKFADNNSFLSAETKIGYEMAEATGLLSTLQEMKIEDFFDFEEYGRSWEANGDITILDSGYIDFGNSDIDLRRYTLDELKEEYGLNETEEVKKLKVVFKEVGKNPIEMEIEDTLEAKQKLVGGLIEVVQYKDDLLLICNEEGKISNLKPNLVFDYDYIVGDCFIIGDDYENAGFKSLTDDEVKSVIKDLKNRAIEIEEIEEVETITETQDDMEF